MTEQTQPSASRVLWCLLGALLGGGGAAIALIVAGNLKSWGWSYPDLAATLLAAVALIITVLGVGLAIAAFWGFDQVRGASEKAAKKAAKKVAIEEVERHMEQAQIRDYLKREAEKILDSATIAELIQSRVDSVLFGGGRNDDLAADDDSSSDEGR